MRDRSLIRLGAGFGVAGAAIAVVVNLLHPRTAGSAETARFELIADSGIWDFVHYLIGVAVLFVLAGYVALERYLDDTPGSAWARLGLAGAIAAAAIGLVVAAVDGFALKFVVDRWAEAGQPDSGATLEAVHSVEAVSTGLFNLFNGTVVGVIPIVGGIAVLRSGRFSAWIGGLGVVGGLIGVAIDFIGTMSELSTFMANVVFTAGALLVTIWAIVVNWTMFQAAGAPAQAVEPGVAATT